MKARIDQVRERLTAGVRDFGLARWIILGFLVAVWVLAAVGTSLNLGTLIGDCLVRTGMIGILVLSLLLPVRAGNGLNFGIPLGIVCGLVGGVFVLEFAGETPFGTTALSSFSGLARGFTGFLLATAISIPLAALAGWGYGWLLERVRGREMMVGIYVGFGAVAGMCVIWLIAALTNAEIILPIGGTGLRQQILLDEHYKWVLDSSLEIRFGEWTAEQSTAASPFQRPEGLYIPTGLLAAWLGACGLMALFLRTKLGTALSAAGSNPEYARSIGIRAPQMRMAATVFSTVLAAIGILVYSQSYGFFQLYKAPLFMAFPTVAALLLGGASLSRATVFHVIVGTILFQSLMTTSLPVVNDLIQHPAYAGALKNLPEIAATVVQNGVILYALTRIVRSR